MINKEAMVVKDGLLVDLGFDLAFGRLIQSDQVEEMGKSSEDQADHIGDTWSLNMGK